MNRAIAEAAADTMTAHGNGRIRNGESGTSPASIAAAKVTMPDAAGASPTRGVVAFVPARWAAIDRLRASRTVEDAAHRDRLGDRGGEPCQSDDVCPAGADRDPEHHREDRCEVVLGAHQDTRGRCHLFWMDVDDAAFDRRDDDATGDQIGKAGWRHDAGSPSSWSVPAGPVLPTVPSGHGDGEPMVV